jgi:hypothetical protein
LSSSRESNLKVWREAPERTDESVELRLRVLLPPPRERFRGRANLDWVWRSRGDYYFNLKSLREEV